MRQLRAPLPRAGRADFNFSAGGLVLGGVDSAGTALLFPLFRHLDVIGHDDLWVSRDDVAADGGVPPCLHVPAVCCDADGFNRVSVASQATLSYQLAADNCHNYTILFC